MTGRTLACAAGLSTALILSGCASDPTEGYAFASPYPEGMRTVAVNVFENDTYERGVEFEFADALVKEIEARTPYKVTSAKRADTILEEVTLGVTIDLNWRDRRTGESLLELRSFTATSLFVPSRPTGEPIELAEFGAVERLARDVVSQMQADW
jgi:hypothetical protein